LKNFTTAICTRAWLSRFLQVPVASMLLSASRGSRIFSLLSEAGSEAPGTR